MPVVTGTEAERPLAATLIEGAITARNIAGETSLVDLVTVAKRARFAVGNDNVYAVGVSYGRAKSAFRSTFFAVPPGILSVPCKTNTAKCTVVRVGSE